MDDLRTGVFMAGVATGVCVLVISLIVAESNRQGCRPRRNHAVLASEVSGWDSPENAVDSTRPPAVPLPDTSDVIEQFHVEPAGLIVRPYPPPENAFVYDRAQWVTVRVMRAIMNDAGALPASKHRIIWKTEGLSGIGTTDENGFCRVLIAHRRCWVTVPRFGSREYEVRLDGNHKVTVFCYFL